MSISWRFTKEMYYQPTCSQSYSTQRRFFVGHTLDQIGCATPRIVGNSYKGRYSAVHSPSRAIRSGPILHIEGES